MAEAKWFDYVRRAFMYHWNLAYVGLGAGAALLSPSPEGFMALLLAGELAYVAAMLGNGRFRTAVDAEVNSQVTSTRTDSSRQTLDAALAPLSWESRDRFQVLFDRCTQMRALAESVHSGEVGVARLRTAGMDQLLWGFVRLLSHKEALGKVLETMDTAALAARVKEIEGNIKKATQSADEPLRKIYEENLITARGRVDFAASCRRDLDRLTAELDRVEDNIQALAEKTVARGGLDVLSAEIDAAAKSVNDTEQTIGSWQSVGSSGLPLSIDAPAILDTAPPVSSAHRGSGLTIG